MNATHLGRRLAAAAALLAAAPAVHAAMLVDDFESYTPGDVDVVATPPWTAEYAGASQIGSDAGNQYIVNGGPGDWAHTYRSLGASVSYQATLSFRIYVEDDAQTDHAIGLTDSSEPVDWYGDYGPYLRVTDDSAGGSGVASIDVRDGGVFVDDVYTINAQQWYDVTMEIDTAGGDAGLGGYDLYVDGSLVMTDVDFRRGYGAPLDNLLLMAGNGALGLVRVDDVYIDVIPEPASAVVALGALACGIAARRRV